MEKIKENNMNLLIISSSQRKGSQSAKIANYLAKSQTEFSHVRHIDLCQQNIPLWDGEESTKFDDSHDWSAINQQIQQADAFVLITPEWGGTASPRLKNLLMMCDSTDTGHKPSLLVSVVSGVSGAYPIAELRMSAFSNNKMVCIPDHLIIRNVEEILNHMTNSANQIDDNIRHRIGYSMHTLKHYSQSLKVLRTNLLNHTYPNQQRYLYGM